MYPVMWDWLTRVHGVTSVLDVGCGDGSAVQTFRDLGMHAIGVDGVPGPGVDIVHDFTEGPMNVRVSGLREFDLVWSCEFVEHVNEEHIPNFLETFKSAPLVMLTHAIPGQNGHHHVNCRTEDYWIGVMAGIGYREDWVLSRSARAQVMLYDTSEGYYAKTGLAFRRRDAG